MAGNKYQRPREGIAVTGPVKFQLLRMTTIGEKHIMPPMKGDRPKGLSLLVFGMKQP